MKLNDPVLSAPPQSLADANALSADAFVARYGTLFEHSPWVVERAAKLRPFADLHAGLMAAVHAASRDDQLALIRAHPELAGKAAIDASLTAASAAEQAGAGLDRLSAQEYARFHALNKAYAARFDFPFIICVRLTDKAGILAAMEHRLGATREAEIATAIAQIGEIVRLRLAALDTAMASAAPVHPELVEGSFFSASGTSSPKNEVRPFDKLRVDGAEGDAPNSGAADDDGHPQP